MDRTITYTIEDQDDGLRVELFLRRRGFSRQNLVEIKRMPRSILVNGEHYYMRQALKAGDQLEVVIQETESSEKIPPVYHPLDIIYEDEDIMVINKPAGMPIHPSLNNYYNSLANGLAWYFEKQGKAFIFRCVNRLDKDTSGLTLIAKHMLSAGILAPMVAAREIHREYLAIVSGRISPASGTIDAPICRTEDSIIERHVDFEKGERSVTHYQLSEYKNGCSLLSIHLETGRTHQIRVHMKHIGFPLIGDSLYNPLYAGDDTILPPDTQEVLPSCNIRKCITRQALHSHRLQFTHPITGESMDFVSPLPPDMARVLEGT